MLRLSLGIVCLFGLLLATLLFFYAGAPWIDSAVIPMFRARTADLLAFGTAGLLCTFATFRFIMGRVWAWWAAIAASGLASAFGIVLFWIWSHPRDDFAKSEGGFLFVVSLVIFVPGAISLALLLMPAVRRYFFSSRAHSPAAATEIRANAGHCR